MTTKLTLFLSAFAVLIALSSAPSFADEVSDAVAAIPPGVEEIHFAGSWSAEDKGGTYRVVLVRSTAKPITARIFVQWIALDTAGASIAQSVEIKEFADLHADAADIFAEGDTDGLAVHIESASGDGFELFASAPGEYRFGRASN
jgi:hypothetical protein